MQLQRAMAAEAEAAREARAKVGAFRTNKNVISKNTHSCIRDIKIENIYQFCQCVQFI